VDDQRPNESLYNGRTRKREKRKGKIVTEDWSSYEEEKSEETLECGVRDEIAMKVNKP